MMNEKILRYYSKKDIQKEMVSIAKNREVAVKFGDKGYGKRPDVLQFEGDVLELARQGATSFHISEERWSDPFVLGRDDKKSLNDFKIGWDLLLDVDSNFLDYSKICAKLIIDALEFYDITGMGIKFSGRSGFHIIVPFELFPKYVNKKEMRFLFPEGTKVVALYLKNMIKDELRKEIMKISNIDEIMKITGKKFNEIVTNNVLNPFCVVDIDPVLIAHRHLFRCSYSLNEKSGLVSIPIDKKNVLKFDISKAKMDKVNTEIRFLNKNLADGEATNLMVQAFDWYEKNLDKNEVRKIKRVYEKPTMALKPDLFAPCISRILEGVKTDGRKRALFVLITYLKKVGYEFDDIDKMIMEWNGKNYEPLKEGYIKSQISWHRRQKEDIMPPNCNNEAYYRDLNVNCNHVLCRNIKNPVQYKKRNFQ